jgi:RNA polymerase sigma-70 factor (ECF subfamily)
MTNVNILIERWQTGDERAVEALYNYHRERVFRLAYGILDNRVDAEEVTQESLIYAPTNIKRYDPRRARFSTWLHTITVSRCRNVLRSRRGLRLSLASWLKKGGDVPDPTPDQERQAVRAEIRGKVWQAVQQLSPPLREAILLRHWSGHTYKEIAEIVDCPLSTAQSRVRLAHQQLRLALGSSGPISLGDLSEESAR